jgi:hypothetical protein
MTYRLTWDMNRGRFRSSGEASLDGADGFEGMTTEQAWALIRANNGNIFDTIQEQKCRAAAKQASQGLDATVADMAKNWKPVGFYTPADFEKMLNSTFAVLKAAGDALDAMNPPSETSRSLRGSITYRYGEALPFVQALNQVKAQGVQVVDAPGFKRWVIKAMNEAALAHEHLAYMACRASWIVTYGTTLLVVCMAAAEVARKIAKVAVQVGQVILKIPDDIGTMYKYATWGVVIGGGLVLWRAHKAGRL